MGKNNYPQSALDKMEPEAIQQIVISLKALYDLGKPQTDSEVEKRIDEYFSLCQRSSIRPGIESLCMALHISRTTLYRWNKGLDCSEYREELIQGAKAFIASFLEQSVLCGKINPASGIFLMKNWLSYKDAVSFEDTMPNEKRQKIVRLEDLPDLRIPETAEKTDLL